MEGKKFVDLDYRRKKTKQDTKLSVTWCQQTCTEDLCHSGPTLSTGMVNDNTLKLVY